MSNTNRLYKSVLFIDASVVNADALAAGVADDVLVVKLASWRDGVEQIATVLRNHEGLDSIQIVSHGAAGQLQLGNTILDSAHLEDYQAAVREWGAALSADGDLLLFGCDVAAGVAGQSFVEALAFVSGADVAASTDITGVHGNWDLEYHSGAIEAASALSAAAEQAYAADLALVNNGSNGTITFGTNANVTLLNATGLAAGTVVHADNILGLGLDLYAQSTNGGGVQVVNVNGSNLIGIPLSDDRLTVNGSLLSPVSYVDLRANSGVFDAVSVNLGSGSLLGNLLGTVVFTVYALDANYQPTGVGVSLTSLLINEYGLLNFASMADFKGIYGIRIVNPLGFEVAIDDLQIANARAANSITSAAYNAGTGVLSLTAVGIRAGDAIDPTKLTITGANGATYTLTSPVVSASSTTAASITLNAADKLALNGLLNNNGSTSVDGKTFNIAAAANWDSNLSNGVDLTGNPIAVSNVQLPTISSASYNAATHVLTVTGANLVGVVGANNDITVAKLGLTGEGGATRFLNTSSNVEVNSSTSFSVTLSGADIAAVEALLNKNGSISAGGTAYTLSAGDDWNSVIGNANTAVSAAIVVVNNTTNSAPTITGTATAGVGDNATIKPFSGVTVADINGDNVSMTISFNAANGTLSGTGLSGSNGSYTLSAATPAALTAALKALTFTPTANHAAVGVGINTTFTLVATDANGASVTNTSTVITATSINDAPVLSGTAAAQNMTAGGTLHPFSSVTLSDPDVGASVIVTITPDSAAKGAFTPASLSASGFVTTDGGVTYTLSAVAPSAAQAALQALIYKSAAGVSATTTFTVAINDGSVIVSNSGTTVVSAVPSGTTALSVAFSSDTGISNSDLITQTAAQNISGTLSSALLSNERVEVSLDNGSTWTIASAATGSTNWQLNGQTLSGSGTLQVRVTNAGGSSTPLSASYSIDNTPPTTTSSSVAFSADTGASPTDLITKTAAQTVSGTLSANLAAGEHVEVSLNNGASWVNASGSTGSNAWSLAGQTLTGSNTLQVRVVDAAGNAGAASSNGYVLDTTAPTVSLSSNVSVLKSGESAVITLTFSETPDGLALGDLTAVGGTLANLVASANPRVYTVEFTPNGGLSGLLGSVTLTNNSYTDLAGNNGSGASSAAISITTLGPSVVITSDAAALKSGDTANITFTFTSAPSGFTASDIVVSGGTISNLTSQGAGIYTAVFTPGTNVSAPASITVASGSYTDGLGNAGGAGLTPVILVDTKAPTLAITSDLATVKAGDVATITFTFSEAPLGFTSGDVAVSGGTLNGFTVTANPLVYTAQFTPSAGIASGAASITVAGSSYTDLIGNSGTAGTSPSISIDTVAPTTTGASFSFSADTGVSNSDLITRTAAQTVSGTLSAALVTGETVQVSMDNGATWSNASASVGSGNWSLAGVTLAGSNTLQVRVNDAAGNHGAAYSAAYVLDTTAPTALATSDLGALNAGQTATLTFSFSEAPANFNASSLTVTGGTISAVVATANPLVYTAVFTPTAGQLGVTATVQVNAGGYIDAAGNNGQASLTVPIAINTTLPSLLITADDVALKAGEAATLTFTFSTPPTGFTAADISYNNGTLSGFAATANPLVYTALFTPNAGVGSGSADISVGAGAYTDAFGNSGSGATGPAISIDTLAPTVAITSNVAAVKAGETAIVTFTFSELPLGFAAGDVVTTGGTLSGLTVNPGNPLVYTATFTPTAGIQNTAASITIAAGAFTDAAGNGNTGSVTPPISIDTLPPTVVASSVLFSADSGSSATDLVTNTSAQTISGTLATPLGSGEYVEVSLDNGASWTTATAGGAGSAWSLSGQTLSGSDTLKVRVTDAAGNHGAAYSVAYVLDTTPPTATISSNVSALKAGETATISFTFSEAPSGFDLNDVSASNGVLSNLTATANPLVYTATYTPAMGLNGVTGNIALTASSYTDKAGNAGGGATSPGINVDTQAPTSTGASVVFSSDSGVADLVTNVAAQNLSGTLSANLLGGETVEVSLDNGASWTSATASVGSSNWSLAGQTLSSGAGHNVQVRVSDAAGNHGAAYSAAYLLDQTAPTLAITSSKAVLNSADAPLITFTFSEAPVGFSAASVTVSGGTLSGFTATANPLVYTAVFTPLAGQSAGVGSVTVAPGAYTDLAGNNGQAGATPTITYATVAPGVAILSDMTALKAGDVANITFKFSSAPVGFAFGDITVNGGTLSGLSATADPLIYTAVFSANAGVANGSGAISIASATFADTLGNLGVGGTMAAIAIDTLAPTLAISSSASSLNSTSTSTATITFTFSEAPQAFSLGDIGATNGIVSNLVQTANPLVYTALFTPAANVAGASAVISVAAGAYADLAGNGGAAGVSPGISIDTLAPTLGSGTLLFSADTGSSNTDLITRTAAQNIGGTLNGGVLVAGDVVEVSLNNGVSWTTASASAGSNVWSLLGQTLNGNGTVQVRVSDANGNHGAVTTHNYVLDTTAPTVAVSSDTSTLKVGQSATISFTFSEAPSGFTLGDLIATGGTLSGFTATNNPLVYTVLLTPTPGFNGNASVTLGNNLYTDTAGNNGSGGNSPLISVDTQAPTLAITSSTSALKAGDSAIITFTFSDAPSAFALGSISASNGTLSGLSATSNPLVYIATFTPGAGIASANAIISVAGSVYADAAGNHGANANSAPIAIDTLAPTASVLALSFSADNGASNSDLVTNAVSQIITGTLSAPVGAGEFVQVSLDNGVTWLNAVTPAPGQWALLPQALTGSGTLQVRVSDAAGNHGAVFSAGYVLDLVAPTMTVTSSASTLKAGEAATLTFTFSEAPSGFTVGDLVAVNGTLSNFGVTANPLVYTVQLTPAAGLSGVGAGITLAPGMYTDLAGNAGGGAVSPLITVDTAPPALQITSSAANLKIGESATITFTFSELPVGFTLGDISVAGGTLSGFGLTANPLVYTALFTPTPGVTAGSGTIVVGAGSFLDAAGNAGLAAAITPINYSTQAPNTGIATVAFSSDTGVSNTDLITTSPVQTISGTLDANVQSGDIVEVSVDNGASWTSAVAPVGGVNWALGTPVFLSGSGTLQVRVTDGAGNHGAAYSAAYVLDITPPTMAISSNAATLKAGESATLTFTFSEAPQGFTAGDIVLPPGSGSISGFTVTANPLVYTAQFTPTAGYSLPAAVSVLAGSYTDTAGNAGGGAVSSPISIDAAPPTLLISSSLASLKLGDTALITFTFSEAPLGFAAGDVTATGGTLSGFTTTANPLVYTAVFTPTPGLNASSAVISVAPNVYSDLAGNGGLGASTPSLSLDTLPPLSAASGTPVFSNDTGVSGDLITAIAAQTVSGTLSLPPGAGESVQVSFDNGGTWSTATVSGSNWSVAHTLTASGVLQVRVIDTAGNYSAPTSTPYVFDQSAPTVAITSNVPVANGVEPAIITFTFSEAPVGFSNSNVTVAGGTLGALTPTSNPLVYTAAFTPTSGVASGSATISVSGSGYTDVAGNAGGSATIPSLQIDTVAPTAAASGGVAFSNDSGTGGDLITNNPNQTLSGTLSAPLAAGDAVQVSVDSGVTWHVAAVSGTTWSLAHTLLSGTRALMVRVADAAGNISAAHTSQYTLDTIAPTVTLSSSATTIGQGGSTTITLTLSDPGVLTPADLVVTGGAVSGFSGSGTTYTVVITPPANSTTPITVNLGGGLFSDAAGNSNTASAPLVVSVNTNAPANPGTPSTVDGVVLTTVTGIDGRTGLPTRTISVPTITATRPEDNNTEHAHLADIPIGIAASGGNPGTSLVVSLPVGVGFEAAGPSSLLSGSMAWTDLIGRIDDHTAAGQATRVAMEAQAQEFLAGLGPNVQLQHATLTMSAASNAAAGVVIVDGSDLVVASSGNAQHDTAPDNTATALVIDTRALPQGIGLQLDNVQFAAIIGAATITGGAGDNFFIGDGAAQRFVLTTGSDNDTVYGNGGDDILITAAGNDYLDGGDGADQLAGGGGNDALHGGAGNDVLQGGRSDAGQWQFYLQGGKVVGIHQTALANATGTETLTAAELNHGEAILGFATSDVVRLESLSLLYHAAFDRAPDLAGLNWWSAQTTLTTQQMAAGFLQAAESTQGLMALSNHDYVVRLLTNTLDKAPDDAALAPYLARLDAAPGDQAVRAGVLADIALSSAHRAAYDSSNGLALGGQLLTQEQGWIANSGDDRLEGGAGNDLLVGGDGTDTVVYSGAASQYSLALSQAGAVMIAEPDGSVDTIRQIELGEFNGVTQDLSFTQATPATLQELGMLYHLTLGRAGDIGGFKFWLDSGAQGSALGAGFLASPEFHNFGTLDDNALITQLYHNIGLQADSAALAKWDGYLDSHNRAELVSAMAHDVTLVGSQFGANGMSLVGSL
jgi:hypothetical protein